MKKDKWLLLSFDMEEFDTPNENGVHIDFDEQVAISKAGALRLLQLLEKYPFVKATFFCTALFAQAVPELINRILAGGHEIASHGYSHSSFEIADLEKSKTMLEQQIGLPVLGFRMARMMPVSADAIADAGYCYDSSINPTFIPGRYNNLNKPRLLYREGDLVQVSSSVTPLIRFPLFWISCHVLHSAFYRMLLSLNIKNDGYAVIYFHPWEFVELERKKYKLPFVLAYKTGASMIDRLEEIIVRMDKKQVKFTTIANLVSLYKETKL